MMPISTEWPAFSSLEAICCAASCVAATPLMPVALSLIANGWNALSVLAIAARVDGATDGPQRNASWPNSVSVSGAAKVGEPNSSTADNATVKLRLLLVGLARWFDLPEILSRHAGKLLQLRVSGGIDRDAAEIVEAADETPG